MQFSQLDALRCGEVEPALGERSGAATVPETLLATADEVIR
jgi:hypothetical protein